MGRLVTGALHGSGAWPLAVPAAMVSKLVVAVAALLVFTACNRGSPGAPTPAETGQDGPGETPRPDPEPDTPEPPPGWEVAFEEDFEALPVPQPSWRVDEVPDDGPFSDAGAYFRARGVIPPQAFRATVSFGDQGWLTAESYSRSSSTPFEGLFSVVTDPADGGNRALRVASPEHTDGTVIRSTEPLPSRYRVSLRVGFAEFGDGQPGLNGYDGGETAEPWSRDDATSQNGFYWLTILDAPPRPHNNTWIHHHRKVVIDSDNHSPPWMEIFDGQRFISSGERPVMMFALDGRGQGHDLTGKPFLSWSNGAWQPSGAIRAVDAYLPKEWYAVTIERFDSTFTLEISGRFRFGGQTTYRATIDAAAHCVWHFNRTEAESEKASGCTDESGWPAGAVWPDYFMFGDPHTNYYEGEVLYDDVRLEVWRD